MAVGVLCCSRWNLHKHDLSDWLSIPVKHVSINGATSFILITYGEEGTKRRIGRVDREEIAFRCLEKEEKNVLARGSLSLDPSLSPVPV